MTNDEIAKLARKYAEEYTREKYPNAPGHIRERIIEGRLEHMKDFIPWLLRTHYIVSKERSESNIISGWVARNKNGLLSLFKLYHPERGYDYNGDFGEWGTVIGHQMIIPYRFFPSLTWDDEPMEVEITIKPKKQSSTK